MGEVGGWGGRKIREVWALVMVGAILVGLGWVGSWRRGLVGSNEGRKGDMDEDGGYGLGVRHY